MPDEASIRSVTFGTWGSRGDALGEDAQGRVVSATGVAPGEVAEVAIEGKGARRAFGSVRKILTPHPDRIDPPCDRTEACGGCPRMFLSYGAQLKEKGDALAEALRGALPGGKGPKISPVLPSPRALRYRDRASFVVAGRAGDLRLGGYGRGSHKVVELGLCPVTASLILDARDRARRVLTDANIPPFDEAKGRGVLRHVLVQGNGREGASGRATLTLVVTNGDGARWGVMAKAMMDGRLPGGGEIAGVSLSVNPPKGGNRILGSTPRALAGDPTLRIHIGEQSLHLPPGAFAQVNLAAADRLYGQVEAWAAKAGGGRALDLYGGVGAIACRIAPHFEGVIGVENVEAATEAARRNGAAHPHLSFLTGDVAEVLGLLPLEKPGEVIIVNPPRKGLGEGVVEAIVDRHPRRVIYVSCNPQSLARDLGQFAAGGMSTEAVQPVDLFPHTEHLESVALLLPKAGKR